MQRILLAVSGASGMPLAHILARTLRDAGVELHLIVSPSAAEVLRVECGTDAAQLQNFAHHIYDPSDMGAPPASGSWRHSGMIVCPCSMATLGAIANGVGTHLIHRAADVCFKERLPLVLVPRETPLSRVHLRNMLAAQEAGAVIMPLCPGFYTGADSVTALLEHLAGRVLDQIGIAHSLGRRWGEDNAHA